MLAPVRFDELSEHVARARVRLAKRPDFVDKLILLGQERALIYKTLVLTGLRKGELASLTLGQLHIDGAYPYAELHAADEKNREGSQIPLRDDLVSDLVSWIGVKAKLARTLPMAFEGHVCQQATAAPRLPMDTPLFDVPDKLVKVFDLDLAAAGIAKRDDRGRTLDVHALRHSFGTLLSKGGVTPRTAQAAMRHSRIDLTMNVYTDPKLLDVHGALDALPALSLNPEKGSLISESALPLATGTSHACAREAMPFADRTVRAVAPTVAPSLGNPDNLRSSVDNAALLQTSAPSETPFVVSVYGDKRKQPQSDKDNGCHKGWLRGFEPPTLRATI
jgi:hypothetical protein